MSRKIARITQDKKLLLANEVVESNAKTSLNSDGRLDTDEIIEYPAELEGGRNLLKQRSDGNYSNVYRDVIIQDGIMYWTQITTATAPFTFYLYDTTLKTDDFIFSFKTNQIQELRPFIRADGKTLRCSPVIVEYEDYYHVSMIFKNITISNYVYFYGTEPFEPPKEVQFWDFKLEKGNIATPWTPAPEDLGLNYPDSIQNFNSSISDNNIIVPEFIEGYPFVKPVIDDSLVLWLNGSTGNNYEQTGIWKDLSGNGNHGQLMNFGYTEGSGWVDGGLKFDGVDDTVILPNIPDLKPSMFSINLILKPEDKNNRHVVFVSWPGYTVELNTNKTISFGLQSPYLRTPTLIEWGKLIHITCVYDGKTQYIYVNGKFSVQKDETLSYSSSDVVISSTRYDVFKGSIFDVKFYNRALTDKEILQNYQAGQCSPLLAMRGDV